MGGASLTRDRPLVPSWIGLRRGSGGHGWLWKGADALLRSSRRWVNALLSAYRNIDFEHHFGHVQSVVFAEERVDVCSFQIPIDEPNEANAGARQAIHVAYTPLKLTKMIR